LHHIIIRGIERRKIFFDKLDRQNFIDRLTGLLPETQTGCYSWVLMPNHAHFLFRAGPQGIATLMRRLLTGYAVSFNHRHRRHGQLFQNRYKSIVCQEDVYLKELVRYIHLNPLRAQLVNDFIALNHYPYCGHSVLMGRQKQPWQDVQYVLNYFGKTIRSARKSYSAYVEAGIAQGRRPELLGGGLIRSLGGWAEVKKLRLKGMDRLKGDERILGDTDFVQEMLAEAKENLEHHYELKRLGHDFNSVVAKVASIYNIEPDEVLRKGRQKPRVDAKALLCYWAARELKMPLTDIARRLDMTAPGVGYAVQRGESIALHGNYQLLH
jgi:REP element-mobilizing transposase RayT